MRKVIQELLDSSISTSAISKGAGVPWSTISDLRKGKTSMDCRILKSSQPQVTTTSRESPIYLSAQTPRQSYSLSQSRKTASFFSSENLP